MANEEAPMDVQVALDKISTDLGRAATELEYLRREHAEEMAKPESDKAKELAAQLQELWAVDVQHRDLKRIEALHMELQAEIVAGCRHPIDADLHAARIAYLERWTGESHALAAAVVEAAAQAASHAASEADNGTPD